MQPTDPERQIAQLEAELAALKARRCETCRNATGLARGRGPVTFEAHGCSVCGRVVFNSDPFWDEDWTQKLDKPRAPAWVVDGSDYWACLYVARDFCCSEWVANDEA